MEAALNDVERRGLRLAPTELRRDGLVENPRRAVWALAGAATVPAEPPVPPDRRTARLKAKMAGLLGVLER